MAKDLVVKLSANSDSLTKALDSAKTSLNNYKKQAKGVEGATQDQVKALEKSITSFNKIIYGSTDMAKSQRQLEKQINNTKLVLSNLSETARNSDFGKAMAKSIEEAEKRLEIFNQQLGKAKGNLNGIGDIKSSLAGLKSGDLSQTLSSLQNLKGSLSSMASGGINIGELVGGAGALSTMGMAAAGIAGVAVAVKEFSDVASDAVQKSAEFGKSISELGAITGVQGKELDNLKGKTLEWAKETNTRAKDVAGGLAQIGSGLPELLSDVDALGEVFKASSSLAKAGLMEQKDATDALISVMQQFNLSSDYSGKAVDVLANAAQKGSAGISDVAATIQRAGVAAGQAGVSFEQAAALTEVLAAKGLKGAEAGTALRNVFTKMSTSGIDEMNPKVVGLTSALEFLQKKSSDATWMVKTFGAENASAASILGQGLPTYTTLAEALEKTGTASSMAADNANNLASQYAGMQVQWDNFLASFNVDDADAPLRVILTSVQNTIDALGELVSAVSNIEIVQEAFTSFGEVGSLVMEVLNTLITVTSDVIGVIGDIVNPLTTSANAFNLVTAACKVFKEMLEFVEVTVTALRIMIHKLVDQFVEWRDNIMQSVGKIPLFEKIGEYVQKVLGWLKDVKKAWNDVKKLFKEERDIMNGASSGGGNNTPKKANATSTSTTNTSSSSSSSSNKTSKTKTEDPIAKAEKEYAKELEYIAHNREINSNKESKSIQDEINALKKLRDTYLRQSRLTQSQKLRVNAITTSINTKQANLKLVLSAEAFEKSVKDYTTELAMAGRQLNDSFINTEEYQSKYRQALNTLINSLYKIENRTDEQERALRSYIRKLNSFDLAKIEDELKKKQTTLSDEINRIDNTVFKSLLTEKPLPNDNYKQLILKMDAANKLIKKISEARENEQPLSDRELDYINNEISENNREIKELQKIAEKGIESQEALYNAQSLEDFKKEYADTPKEFQDAIANQFQTQLEEFRKAVSDGVDAEREIAELRERNTILEQRKNRRTGEGINYEEIFEKAAKEFAINPSNYTNTPEGLDSLILDIKRVLGDKPTLQYDIARMNVALLEQFKEKNTSEITQDDLEEAYKAIRQVSIDDLKGVIDDAIIKNLKNDFSLMENFRGLAVSETSPGLQAQYQEQFGQRLLKLVDTLYAINEQTFRKFEQSPNRSLTIGTDTIRKTVADINKALMDRAEKDYPLGVNREDLDYFIGVLEQMKLTGVLDEKSMSEISKMYDEVRKANAERKENPALEGYTRIYKDQRMYDLPVDERPKMNDTNSIYFMDKLVNDIQKLWDKLYQKFDEISKTDTSRGDLSNYNLNQTSAEQLSKTTKQKIDINADGAIQKLENSLSKNLDKYTELEKIIISEQQKFRESGLDVYHGDDEEKKAQKLQIETNLKAQKEQLRSLEREIDKEADVLRHKLTIQADIDIASNALNGISQFGSMVQSWESLGDSIDNASNSFDAFMSVFNTIVGTFQGVIGIIESFNTISSLMESITTANAVASTANATAKEAEGSAEIAKGTAFVATKEMEGAAAVSVIPELLAAEAAYRALTAAETTAAHASIPFAGPALAAGAMAEYEAIWAMAKLPTFADGGVFKGASRIGDYNLARVNNGEMIMNGTQQERLWNFISGQDTMQTSNGSGEVSFRIRGEQLFGVLKNYQKTSGKRL